MPSANLLSLVVKIENVQYGKRVYAELGLVLRGLIKEGVIKEHVNYVSIECVTEAVRSLYGKYLHGKRVTLFNKESALTVEGMVGANCGDESEFENDSGDSNDFKPDSEGDDEGDIDVSPRCGIKGAILQDNVEGGIGKVHQESSTLVKTQNQASTAFRAQGWRPIGDFKDIIRSTGTSNAFAEMALLWVRLLAQKNSLSLSDIHLEVHEKGRSLSVKANFNNSKPDLGYFHLDDQSGRNPRLDKLLAEFVIRGDPVGDNLPVCQSPTHTPHFHGICAALVQSGFPVSFSSHTHKQEFDSYKGIFGFYHSERIARSCRARFPKNALARKCGGCCGTRIRVGGQFSSQIIPAKNGKKNRKWVQKDEYHSWLWASVDLAISAGVNVSIPESARSKYFAARALGFKVNSEQPNSTPAIQINSTSRIPEEPILSLRSVTPPGNGAISRGPPPSSNDYPRIPNIESKSSLAYELVDRVIENSTKLVEAQKTIAELELIGSRAEDEISKQRQHIASILDLQEKSTQEWEKKLSDEKQKTALLQKSLGEIQKSNTDLTDKHATQISDLLRNLQAKESLLRHAEDKIRTHASELELRKANDTIIGYQLREELRLANEKIASQHARITEIHSQKNTMGTKLRDLQADYDIQGRKLRSANEDKDRVIEAMREAGYDFEVDNERRKRGPSNEDEDENCSKKVKTEQ